MADVRKEFEAFKAQRLKLDLTRGKPSSAQLALSAALLALPGVNDYMAESATDVRNYGGLQGLVEARRLFAPMMGAPVEQVIVANNSSLALMHDSVVFLLLHGTADSHAPWIRHENISFICPVPGYDRHFRICQDLGIKMISVPLNEDGPDVDQIEQLVADDPMIKGMWCTPKYSNPTGSVYSTAVIDRLAGMKTAAKDFRLFWDNAYGVHHLTPERLEVANILDLCAKHGYPNRPLVFSSTSKITLAGSGLALFAGSPDNVRWFLVCLTPRTIGPDKVNQLRHVRFLKDHAGIEALMDKHRALIAPKFRAVIEAFDQRLSDVTGVEWTRPKGGYFISLDVTSGCAQRVVSLAKEAGIALTPAGSTHPYGRDPEDRILRIAPTFPELPETTEAAQGVALSVLLALSEKRRT